MHGPPAVRTLDLTTLAPQPGFAAVATAAEDPGFDAERVVAMTVRLGGSGAIDDLTFFSPTTARTIDFEDLGLAPGEGLHPPDLVGIESHGFLFAPTLNSSFLDVHATNAIPGFPYNGTTVLAGHDEILMTRVGGGPFSLHAFDLAGFVNDAEVPFSVHASSGAVAHFVPDGLCDGAGGVEDFETFVLPAGFEDVESVLFVHTGPGTNAGTFDMDDLAVSFPAARAGPRPVGPRARPAAPLGGGSGAVRDPHLPR